MKGEAENPHSRREKAVEALIESFQARFPQKGFLLHPSLQFTTASSTPTGRGMRVVARDAIERNQTLLVIPNKSQVLESTRGSIPKELLPLHKKLTKKFRAKAHKIEGLESLVPLADAWLAIRIMKLLSEKHQLQSKLSHDAANTAMDPLFLQADTWPSEDELRDSYYGYWEKTKVESIWGYKSGLTLDWIHRTETLNKVFENLIYPILRNEANGGTDFVDKSLPSNVKLLKAGSGGSLQEKEMLRNTFWYADGIVFTRTHGMVEDDYGETGCKLIPLVDLFNGDTDGATVKTSTAVNVALAQGKWPFLGGGNFVNECNLSCSCVYALRNIPAGEELIISYGENLTVNHFLMKYGTVPKSLLDPKMIRCNIRLWCDPTFLPSDALRIACLRKIQYPLEDLANDRDCTLTDIWAYGEDQIYKGKTSLEVYREGFESGDIASMRQFLIVALLADEYELNRNLDTGKLRGALYAPKIFPFMLRMIDYNIELLQGETNATSSSDDVKTATAKFHEEESTWEASALLARVAYREALLAWRHAFVQKAVEISGPEVQDLLYESAHPCCPTREIGCQVCGRTYPSMKCGRCKGVRYCSREHQKSDWKFHKVQCKKVTSK